MREQNQYKYFLLSINNTDTQKCAGKHSVKTNLNCDMCQEGLYITWCRFSYFDGITTPRWPEDSEVKRVNKNTLQEKHSLLNICKIVFSGFFKSCFGQKILTEL